jgi:hypothetical protein
MPDANTDKQLDQQAYDEFIAMRTKDMAQLNAILPAADRRRTYTFGELYKGKDQVQRFIIPDLIPQGALTVLIGEDGIGKTQLMTQLCLAIAMGETSFLTLPLETISHKRCLICATEDSKQKFIGAASKQFDSIYQGEDPNKCLIDFTEGSDFDSFDDLKEELNTKLDENFYDLIVVDALGDLFTLLDGDINSNSDARRLLGHFQHLCNERDTTIIIIHHAAKSKIVAKRKEGKLFVEKNDQQGAGAITQKPRTVLALTRDPKGTTADGQHNKNYFHVVKANLMGKKYERNAIECQFDGATLLHRATGLVDVEMEQPAEEQEQGLAGKPQGMFRQKSRPDDIDEAAHRVACDAIFSTSVLLSKTELVTRMKQQYGVGQTKIESAGGFLNHLITSGLISRQADGLYKYNEPAPF